MNSQSKQPTKLDQPETLSTLPRRWLALLWLVPIVLIIVILIIGTLRYQNGDKSSGISVVAAENFWGNIATQIGGNKVSVSSIITNPNLDPHLYESDARDAAEVGNAKIVIMNGLGYDDFISKLMASSPNSDRQVITAATVVNLSGTTANPHLWYDTAYVKLVAANIEQTLIRIDKKNANFYETNLAAFDNSLNPVLAIISTISTKYSGTAVAYTERVPQYLISETGLTNVTSSGFAEAIENGTDPSPADTLTMNNLITSHSIKVLFYNTQTVSAVTAKLKGLALQNGIAIIGVSETMPTTETSYQSWQLHQDQALLGALGN
ncbi:MAG: metal ABC transporter solute-binding protein, Zn/Mn family [Candidatus Saccharimonadia bacterium]